MSTRRCRIATGRRPWLRLLDAVKSHGGRCLLSAAMPPDRLAIARMPDLRTRLCASACFALRKLDDNEHAEMLKARGQRLGLALSSDAVHWMLTHLPRDTPSLLAALARIDRAALAARRQPTLPFCASGTRRALKRLSSGCLPACYGSSRYFEPRHAPIDRVPAPATRRAIGPTSGSGRSAADPAAARLPATRARQRPDRAEPRRPQQPDHGDPGLVSGRRQGRSAGAQRLRGICSST